MKIKQTRRSDQENFQSDRREIAISHLHLDLQNPRHEVVDSEGEAITHLCGNDNVLELATDIAARGALSPLDSLGVIPQEGNPGHYVALEGNRRVCALILLADPERAPTPALRSQFQRISQRNKAPRKISVHVFENRSAAAEWIELRHLGEQGGVGTRVWSPTQQARAAGTNARTSAQANKLALDVLDQLVKVGLLNQEDRKKVALTTITRYLNSPVIRATLGLGSNKELIYTYDPDEVNRALYRLVRDSIKSGPDDKPAVHTRNTSKEREAYVTGLQDEGVLPTTRLTQPIPPPEVSRIRPLTKGSRSSRNPVNLPTLIDNSFTIKSKDQVLLRLRSEALKLRLDDFPFSGNYLLRALIEQIMILFLKKRGRFSDSLDDRKLTQLCAEELKKTGATRKTYALVDKAAGSQDHPFSLHSLGHAVHGGHVPTRSDLRSHFDSWRPALEAMLAELK